MEKKSRNSPEQLTLFAAGSRDCVSPIHKPGSAEARQMTATSGRKCLELFKNSNLTPVGLLQKMLLGSSIWSSTARYLTWKGKVTKSGYSYWVLSVSKPPIKDKDAGSSEEKEMWPTPNASAGGPGKNLNNPRGVQQGNPLATAVKMWPTPTVQDSNKATKKWREDHQNNLTAAAFNPEKMFPTATARDYKGGYKTESLTRKDGKSRTMDALPNAVLDGKGTETVKGQLNAEWVTWLMGYPPNYLTLEEPGK